MAGNLIANKRTLKVILFGLLGLIVLFSFGSLILVKNVYDGHFPRRDKPDYTGYLRYSDVAGQYPRTVVHFQSGPNTLTGYVYGEANRKGLVVIAHGLGFGAENYLAETLYFVDHGWRVFSFDCTGTDESEGKNTVGLPQSLIDLNAALSYIERDPELQQLPMVLYGHSWGGYSVTAILNDSHKIRAVASLAGFNSPTELMAEELNRTLGLLGPLEVPFGWVYQSLRFGETARVTAVDGINRSGIPVLLIHGEADESVLYSGASIIAHRAEITNPRVVYKTCSTPNHNGHNDLAKSEASRLYIEELNQVYLDLNEQYDGRIPDDVRAQFYAGVDKFKTSELNPDFMDEINAFFEAAITD